MEEEKKIRIEEYSSVLVQLLNIVIEGISKDKKQLRDDIISTYNKIISTLSLYVDFKCLDPYTRSLLESNLMSDIILSHLEMEEDEDRGKKGWIKLSGRTKGLIAIALIRCAKPPQISLGRETSLPEVVKI